MTLPEDPAGNPNPYEKNPYGQNPYGQNPYAQAPDQPIPPYPTTPNYGQYQAPGPYGPPGGYQPGYPAPGYPAQGYGQVAAPTNGLAIGALVCGIIGLLTACFLILPGVALGLGLAGRKQIAENGQQGDGMALAGIIMGGIGLALGVLWWVLAIIGDSWAWHYST